MALVAFGFFFSFELLARHHIVIHGLTFHGLVEVDISAEELGTIDAGEFGLASDAHTAGTAHARAVDHNRVERHRAADAQLLAGLGGKLHHDHWADSHGFVILFAAGHELTQHVGHQTLAARGAVVGGDIKVTDFSQFLFEDEQVLGAGADDAVGRGTMVVQPLHLGINRGDTHAAADEDEATLAQFLSRHRGKLGGLAQGADDVGEAVAFLVFRHLFGRFTYGLKHDGHCSTNAMVVADGQRDAFRVLLHLDDEELTRQGRMGDTRRIDVHEVGLSREGFFVNNLEHIIYRFKI